jgi:hypothetical protein
MREILESHLIEDADDSGLYEDDFTSFIEYRAGCIVSEIRRHTGQMTEVETDFSGNEAKAIEKFELQMRDLLHSQLASTNADYWGATGEAEFRAKIEERITDWLKHNPGRQRHEAREIDFCQILEYLKVAKSHWGVFEPLLRSKSDLEMHLKNISNFRNALMHNRSIDISVRQLALGSLSWFERVFQAKQE